MKEKRQAVFVFQQNGAGESKVNGVKKYGNNRFDLQIFSVEGFLPQVIEDSENYIPFDFKADIVLDFLKHPDLSIDLFELCQRRRIPVIASGKKIPTKWALTPPT